MATFTGTASADTIKGTSGSDVISSFAGDDTVEARDGNDTVFGGAGADTISGGDGNDNLNGEDGNDTIVGDDGNDILSGGSGDDILSGGKGNDTLLGGDGDDLLDGGADNDTISAGAGDDRILLSLDHDTIDGSLGTDTIDASALNGGVSINLALGTASGQGFKTQLLGIENVIGSTAADMIVGTIGDNVIFGNGGNDTISGGLGNDTIIAGSGNATYSGDGGNDTLIWTAGTAGSQVFNGGSGQDAVSIILSSGQLTSAVVEELSKFSTFLADSSNAGKTFQFAAIGNLQVAGAETLSLSVDGVARDIASLLNAAPQIVSPTPSELFVSHNGTVTSAIAATDANGDQLSYTVLGGAAHGQVALDVSTGRLVYTAGDFVGDDAFTVRVADGHGGYADHAISVHVTNAGPEILSSSDASLSVGHGREVTGHVAAQDPDGDTYRFSIATGPQHGTLVFTDDTGSYVYQADDYVGYDSFTVRVSDGHGGFAEHQVRVEATNTGPVIDKAASTSYFSTVYGTNVPGLVSAIDADGDSVTFTLKTGPAHGSVAVAADGHFSVSTQDYAGTDSFVVTASDGHGGSVDHTVSFGVIGTLDASSASGAVSVNLTTGAAIGVDQSKMPWAINIAGSAFNDLLYGDSRDNILSGGAGKDEVHGNAGNDRVDGGAGDDKLFGEDGNDLLIGGDGNDSLNGGAHNDEMRGGAGNDGFFGGGGNDTLYGDAGDDRLYGDGGDDILRGGAGNDVMTGAGSNNGGAKGANTYIWDRADVLNANGSKAGLDHITDFGVGDRLDFTGLVSNHSVPAHDVVRVTDTAAGLVVAVDMGGSAGFVDVVILDNVHGVNVDDLAHNGAITV